MDRNNLNESLSALMDNEADELELRRILAQPAGELDSTWARYQLASAALHGKAGAMPNWDLSARISAALADEATPVAAPVKARPVMARFAVAASVMLAVLGGVKLYQQTVEPQALPLAQQNEAPRTAPYLQGPAILAGYNAQGPAQPAAQPALPGDQSLWIRQRYPNYLRQHLQQGANGSPDAVLPYARGATLDER